jgi:hypothetical protein
MLRYRTRFHAFPRPGRSFIRRFLIILEFAIPAFDPSPHISSVHFRMRLSKQHKVYGAVLGLALAALGADRFFSSAPAEASESFAVTTTSASAAKPAALAKTAANGNSLLSSAGDDRRAISARLDELAQTAGLKAEAVRDAFAPGAAWGGAIGTGSAKDEERARQFTAEHHLTAVMGNGSSRNVVAVVDGKPLRPGQTLDGFTLISVSAREVKAVFERKGATAIELRLKEVAPAAAAATVAQAN